MAQIKWAAPALADLDEIAEYIALDNPNAARKLVQSVLQSVERLKDLPESGRKPPELQDSRYREVIDGPCRIFYRVNEDITYILYVMRSERELRNFLLETRIMNHGI